MKENKQENIWENETESEAEDMKTTAKPMRTYKDRIFRMIFQDKQKLLELYNAINGTDYQDPGAMTITTLENAIYMGMKNDVSFLLYDQLSLYEHQSTNNPNMPLRNLFYISDVYSGLTKDCNLYSTTTVLIPEPQFLVFYNGQEDMPERWEQKLSEAYMSGTENPSLELRTTVLNINLGKNKELAEKCYTLLDYMKYVGKVRKYRKNHSLAEAVELAVDECIREGILAEFLKQNRAEAIKVSIYEYDEEEYIRKIKEDERKQGLKQGLKQGMDQGLKEGLQWIVKSIYINLQRGTSPEIIAEQMAIENEIVEKITTIANEYVAIYEWEEVSDKILEKYISVNNLYY